MSDSIFEWLEERLGGGAGKSNPMPISKRLGPGKAKNNVRFNFWVVGGRGRQIESDAYFEEIGTWEGQKRRPIQCLGGWRGGWWAGRQIESEAYFKEIGTWERQKLRPIQFLMCWREGSGAGAANRIRGLFQRGRDLTAVSDGSDGPVKV